MVYGVRGWFRAGFGLVFGVVQGALGGWFRVGFGVRSWEKVRLGVGVGRFRVGLGLQSCGFRAA